MSAGPSPRARGSHHRERQHGAGQGAIPASAGKPSGARSPRSAAGGHPRERGEACSRGSWAASLRGPSPRARGSRRQRRAAGRRGGAIPASAGKPRPARFSVDLRRGHPRERGEANFARSPSACSWGPSPRARGSRDLDASRRGVAGAIPASAGKPPTPGRCPRPGEGHPRERGEAARRSPARDEALGPSPRARGSLARRVIRPAINRAIPASAGKPNSPRRTCSSIWGHPRERGEAMQALDAVRGAPGPSPRARGSPGRITRAVEGAGAIPASAGKPDNRNGRSARARGHPRERGEAAILDAVRRPPRGPSPRARGSRLAPGRGGGYRGAIPASAGKPASRSSGRPSERGHPRERGEAIGIAGARGRDAGPSPRARGSPGRGRGDVRNAGAIPASAGKPDSGRRPARSSTGHPRERGEAGYKNKPLSWARGPSPRARGSLGMRLLPRLPPGAIPASAGKPSSAPGCAGGSAGHPRERGEADGLPRNLRRSKGPSPRARGSRRRRRDGAPLARAIPASAGKPLSNI